MNLKLNIIGNGTLGRLNLLYNTPFLIFNFKKMRKSMIYNNKVPWAGTQYACYSSQVNFKFNKTK